MRYIAVLIWLLVLTGTAKAQTVFTVRGPEYPGDVRMNYDFDLLKLALDKTADSFGPYELRRAPMGINFKRALEFAKSGQYPNMFVRNLVSEDAMLDMLPVIFPVERGITGYRIALIKPHMQEELKDIKDISDLRKFDIIQGIGWPDNRILRSNGLRVITGPSFPSIREMVTHDRAHLFLRGVNEIIPEANDQQEELVIEEGLLIQYPFPRFFFTAKENRNAAKRVEIGLIKACNDGSFIELWEKYFRSDLTKLQVTKRHHILLKNPFLEQSEGTLRELERLPAECRHVPL